MFFVSVVGFFVGTVLCYKSLYLENYVRYTEKTLNESIENYKRNIAQGILN